MSLVTRGLGLGGILVTAGLALTIGIVVVPPTTPIPDRSWNVELGPNKRKNLVDHKVEVTVTIPAVQGRGLLADIEARGAALVGIYIQDHSSSVGIFKPAGAGKATVIGVSSSTKLGQILASGEHDMEDSDLLAMILALLDT
jgi:hypothetical protein